MDISCRKEAEQAIAHLAQHDVLTGLPNRALFHERLQQQISEAERHGGCFAVLACDLDRFKAVNDTLGHAAGDALLGEIATAPDRGDAGTEDTVARLGGDEFSIVLGHLAGHDDAYAAAERIIDTLSAAGERVRPGCAGLASASASLSGAMTGLGADELCRRADTAMYVAKINGRNTYRAYNANMDVVRGGPTKLEDDHQDAVQRAGFLLCYQPAFALDTGKISSFEALPALAPPDTWSDPVRRVHSDGRTDRADGTPGRVDVAGSLPRSRDMAGIATRRGQHFRACNCTDPVWSSASLSALADEWPRSGPAHAWK